MTPRTLADLSDRQVKDIKGMLKIHDRWNTVYDNLEEPEGHCGIILVDTYRNRGHEAPTMATPRFLDDIEQTALHIREITTVDEDDTDALEAGGYVGALRINLDVGQKPRIIPKSSLLTGTIPDY